MWNDVALSLLEHRSGESDENESERYDRRRYSTVAKARLFARLNLAIADAAIGCWDVTHVFWRPVTAIPWPRPSAMAQPQKTRPGRRFSELRYPSAFVLQRCDSRGIGCVLWREDRLQRGIRFHAPRHTLGPGLFGCARRGWKRVDLCQVFMSNPRRRMARIWDSPLRNASPSAPCNRWIGKSDKSQRRVEKV